MGVWVGGGARAEVCILQRCSAAAHDGGVKDVHLRAHELQHRELAALARVVAVEVQYVRLRLRDDAGDQLLPLRQGASGPGPSVGKAGEGG